MVKAKTTTRKVSKVQAEVKAVKKARRLAQKDTGEKEVKEEVKPIIMRRFISPEKLLKEAKRLGLFKHNKKYRQYEIIVPVHEYREL